MLKPIPIPNVEYEPLNISNIGPINKFTGVSTLDPFNIPTGSATSMKNLTASGGGFPALATRPAFTQLGGNLGKIQGMALHMNKDLHAVANTSTQTIWSKWNGASWETILTVTPTPPPPADKLWSFANFKGNFQRVNLIATVNGIAYKYDSAGSGAASQLAGVPAGVNFTALDQHDDRLYATDGRAVYFSAIGKAEDWSSTGEAGAGSIQIETNSGEDVNAIRAGSKHLMLFKRNMFAELWGTRPSNYQLQRISETGAVGLNAVTVYDQTTYWIHDSGAFQYAGGLPRKDFSVPVIGYFANMNKAAAANACAVSTKDGVLFSIPTGTSTVNDTTLEYLPDFGIWSVWKDFAPTSWVYWNSSLVYGDANGVYMAASNANNVAWEWVSPPFGGGPFSNRHQWYKLFYVIDVPVGSSLTAYVSSKAEGNAPTDWIQVSSEAGRALANRRVIVPIQQVANSNWLRVKFVGTGPVKFHELNIQQREMPLR